MSRMRERITCVDDVGYGKTLIEAQIGVVGGDAPIIMNELFIYLFILLLLLLLLLGKMGKIHDA